MEIKIEQRQNLIMKILHSKIFPGNRLIIEDDDPALNQSHYQGQAPVAAPAQGIEPLPVLTLGYEKPPSSPFEVQAEPAGFPRYKGIESQVLNVPAANDTVEPLLLPTMNFEKPGARATRKAPSTSGSTPTPDVRVLPLPSMTFQRPGRR